MSKKSNIQAIILAAGLSRRMGSANKLLLPYGQHTILAEVISQLKSTSIESIQVVLGHEKDNFNALLDSFGLQKVYNPDYLKGQGFSIRAGVKNIPASTTGFMICLGDMPTLKSQHYQLLIDQFESHLDKYPQTIFRPFNKNQPGHPVFFSFTYRDEILASQEAEGCREVIRKNKTHLIRYETETTAYFLDIDTREEYEEGGVKI